jgi:hypothetical protein
MEKVAVEVTFFYFEVERLRKSIYKDAIAACLIMRSLPLPKEKHFETVSFLFATAIQTVPTGFSGVPPSGPAMPETAMLQSTFAICNMFFDICSTTSLLTAPF